MCVTDTNMCVSMHVCVCAQIYISTDCRVLLCWWNVYCFKTDHLLWTTSNVAHTWKKLILLQAIINCLYFFLSRSRAPQICSFPFIKSVDITIVLFLFMKAFLVDTVSLQKSWYSGSHYLSDSCGMMIHEPHNSCGL